MEIREIPPTSEVEIDIIVPNAATGIVGSPTPSKAPEEDPPCSICMDLSVYDGNEIIFCDKCNVAVHQACYGVDTVPTGNWYCDPCAAGMNTTTLSCEVCSFTGGAYKPTAKDGKWVHSLCSIWIPEIFHTKGKDGMVLTTSSVDKARFRLKCALCSGKGACIQCSYGRCMTSVHPWCVLNTPKGFTRRVIKDEEDVMHWEIFCKAHASEVSKPIKPKPKPKVDNVLPIEDPAASEEVIVSAPTPAINNSKPLKPRKSEVRKARGFMPFSMMHSLKFNPMFILGANSSSSRAKIKPEKEYKEDTFSDLDEAFVDMEDNEDWDDDSTKAKPKRGRPKKKGGTDTKKVRDSVKPERKSDPKSSGSAELRSRYSQCKYPLLNMSEWPGQSEGEAMDLEHFWDVVGMSYPEDKPADYMEEMLEPFTRLADIDDEMDDLMCLPCLGPPSKGHNRERIAEELEVTLNTLGTEKERYALFDFDKRKDQLSGSLSRSHDINKSTECITAALKAMQAEEYVNRIRDEGAVVAAAARPMFGVVEPMVKSRDEQFSGSKRSPSLTHDTEDIADEKPGGVQCTTSDWLETSSLSVGGDDKKSTAVTPINGSNGKAESVPKDMPTSVQTPSSSSSVRRSSLPVSVPVTTRTGMINGKPLKIYSVDAEPIIDDGSFFVKRKGDLQPIEKVEEVDCDGNLKMRVAFDGPQRLACEFRVRARRGDGGFVTPGGGKTHSVNLHDPSTVLNAGAPDNCGTVSAMRDILKKYMIHSQGAKGDAVNGRGTDKSTDSMSADLESVYIHLENVMNLPDRHTVFLSDSQVIANEENDLLTRLIRTEQVAYAQITKAVADKVKLTPSFKRSDMSNTIANDRNAQAATVAHYVRQRVWAKVASAALRGMRDQRQDFNDNEDEAIPASWQIAVDGRPSGKDDDDVDGSDDAVCMACFDGASSGGNSILFCDGCNAAMHQCCYGVPEIPEGDFFCDRCKDVKLIAADDPFFEPEMAKDAVKCCLCPLHHGAIKRTTDGRWVHLCCALWADGAIITDVQEMSLIDVSKVPVQVPEPARDFDMYRNPLHADNSTSLMSAFSGHNLTPSGITEACSICRAKGGYVVRCCGSTGSNGVNADCKDGAGNGSAACSAVFHPLCAWFAGLLLQVTSTDESFQANNHGTVYPAGLKYTFYCPRHYPSESVGEVRNQQAHLRQKYRIHEGDLEHIPGKGYRRKKKKNKPQRPSMLFDPTGGAPSSSSSSRQRQSVGGESKIADLKKDTYDDKYCAYCMGPLDPSYFTDEGSLALTDEGIESSLTQPGLSSTTMPMNVDVKSENRAICGPVSEGSQTSSRKDFMMASEIQNRQEGMAPKPGPAVAMQVSSNGETVGEVAAASTLPAQASIGHPGTTLQACGSSHAPKASPAPEKTAETIFVKKESSNGVAHTSVPNSANMQPLLHTLQTQEPKSLHGNGEAVSSASMPAPHPTLNPNLNPKQAPLPSLVHPAVRAAIAADLAAATSSSAAKLAESRISSSQIAVDIRKALPGLPSDGKVGTLASTQSAYLLQNGMLPGSMHASSLSAKQKMVSSAAKGRGAYPPSMSGGPSSMTPAAVAASQKHMLKCSKCHIYVHRKCLEACNDQGARGFGPDGSWTCSACAWGQKDPRCELCPRRNGGFRPTADGKWAHLYCARHSPGDVRVLNGIIDIRHIPKELKKEKCFVCNRKKGASIKCNFLGCSQYFHPLCGVRSGKVYIARRNGHCVAYCSEHIPDQVEKVPPGFWVDGEEVLKYRRSLDCARTILEILSKREKLKLKLCKAEVSMFSKHFARALDKAKGRKPTNGTSLGIDIGFEDSDVDVDDGDEGDYVPALDEEEELIARAKADAMKARKSSHSEKGQDVTLKLRSGEEVFISGSWTQKKKVAIPTVVVATAGLEILTVDAQRASDRHAFMKELEDRVDRRLDASRVLFASKKEASQFEESLTSQLKAHLLMTPKEFQGDILKSQSGCDFKKLCREITGAPKDKDWTGKFFKLLLNPPAKTSLRDQLDVKEREAAVCEEGGAKRARVLKSTKQYISKHFGRLAGESDAACARKTALKKLDTFMLPGTSMPGASLYTSGKSSQLPMAYTPESRIKGAPGTEKRKVSPHAGQGSAGEPRMKKSKLVGDLAKKLKSPITSGSVVSAKPSVTSATKSGSVVSAKTPVTSAMKSGSVVSAKPPVTSATKSADKKKPSPNSDVSVR